MNVVISRSMSITPFILGTGRSGQAIAKSLAVLNLQQRDLKIEPAILLKRGADLATERKKATQAILCIANPHGLHADAIIAGSRAGFDAILCEKPACVNLEQLQALREIKAPTAVLHVYREMWGVQMLKAMVNEGVFGQLITIEGRYWQGSAAVRALASVKGEVQKNWKDDPTLSGPFDTYLDLATHYLDTVSFLYGSIPSQIKGWKSMANASAPHRDNHVQLSVDYPNGGRSFASISKTMHGATNLFEVNLIGTLLSATWKFENPDEIFIGEGRNRRVLTRNTNEFGSKHPPYHGMGWLEGYIEIASQLLNHVYGGKPPGYPQLKGNLDLLESMFKVEW